jgi:hypothetical protein
MPRASGQSRAKLDETSSGKYGRSIQTLFYFFLINLISNKIIETFNQLVTNKQK